MATASCWRHYRHTVGPSGQPVRRWVVILENNRVLRVAEDVTNGWKQVRVQNIPIFLRYPCSRTGQQDRLPHKCQHIPKPWPNLRSFECRSGSLGRMRCKVHARHLLFRRWRNAKPALIGKDRKSLQLSYTVQSLTSEAHLVRLWRLSRDMGIFLPEMRAWILWEYYASSCRLFEIIQPIL